MGLQTLSACTRRGLQLGRPNCHIGCVQLRIVWHYRYQLVRGIVVGTMVAWSHVDRVGSRIGSATAFEIKIKKMRTVATIIKCCQLVKLGVFKNYFTMRKKLLAVPEVTYRISFRNVASEGLAASMVVARGALVGIAHPKNSSHRRKIYSNLQKCNIHHFLLRKKFNTILRKIRLSSPKSSNYKSKVLMKSFKLFS